MLPKKKRITKKDFQLLMKEGKTLSTPLFLFYFIKSETPQYAFVAPKGVFKIASKRNKYRRIGYNILRGLPFSRNSGIFMYKKQSMISTQQEIRENIIYLLKKANCLE